MSNSMSYAGDVDVNAAYAALSASPNTVLVDVRTRAEWNFVGVPDLRALGKEVIFTEWQGFPAGSPVPDFVATLSSELERKGLDKTVQIYFLCRSGARSLNAAIAMTQAGYGACFNIADGFEGPLDGTSHRGNAGGWKASGLPWIQS